jgi:hypothetical protein
MRSIALVVSCVLACGCSAEPPAPAGVAEPEPESGSASREVFEGFDRAGASGLAAGWRVGATKPDGPLATWEIVPDPSAPSPPNALALTSPNHDSGSTFNLCWSDALRFQDGVLELAFRANGGEGDQGGGPIWRVQDEGNYYICRANPLESNFRLYCVQDGTRHQLASAEVVVSAETWHRIRVEHAGQHIVCILDGTTRLEASDGRLPGPGGVGLWTKADAETSFDDLRILPAR